MPARATSSWLLHAIAVIATVAISLLAHTALAAEPERYEVDARIDRAASQVVIEERIAVRVAEGEASVRLWIYADRLSARPRVLGERTWRWLYPGEVDLGRVAIERVTAEGVPLDRESIAGARQLDETGFRARDAAGCDLVIPIEPGAARTIELALELRVRLPDRFGRLGRDGGTWTLAAPWYPLVVTEDDGWRFGVPQRVRLRDEGATVALGSERFARGATAEVETVAPYVPAMAVPSLDVWTGRIAGVEVVWTSFEPIYRTPSRHAPGVEGVADFVAIDRVALLHRALEPVIATARWLGLTLPPRIELWTVPSRTELVATAPGHVLVSDRWGQIFPVDAALDFHLRAMRRALFGLLAQPAVDDVDAPPDRNWTEDLRSVVLLELDEVRRTSRAQSPEQLLSALAFHPAIDQLLYAPQIAFDDVYFASVDEPDPYRDDPARARLPVARGRRILEGARDALASDAFQRWVAMIAHQRRSVRAALERVDSDASEHLATWLAYPMLEVNYRLGAIRSEPIPEGGFRHYVEVIREGAYRPEIVEVEVEDVRGARVRASWDGRGDRGEVVAVTAAERRSVTIDPRHRLPQSPRISEGHPRRDDATDQPWRPPVFTGFAFDVLASEANVTGLIDVILRQRYDLEHTFGLRLVRTAARTGGRLRYMQGVGPKVHNNRRVASLGGGIGAYYVHPGFGGSALGGWAAEIDLLLSLDTRSFLQDWREGFALACSVQATTTVREDGTVGASGRASARGSVTWSLGNLNTFVLVGHAGVTVAPVLDADLQSAGGRYGLRGFANDELLGTSAMYAVAEHRVTIATDLAYNVFHLLWARELQLAWWLGGGAVLGTVDRRPALGAAEVGLGFRVHYEYAGVQPGVLAIDVGLPISRWAQQAPCAFAGGADGCDRRVPIGFYVSVDQYY